MYNRQGQWMRLWEMLLIHQMYVTHLYILYSIAFTVCYLIQSEGIDAEVDAKVDQVLIELTTNILSNASAAPVNAIPKKTTAAAAVSNNGIQQPIAAAEEDGSSLNDDQMAAMRARLQAL